MSTVHSVFECQRYDGENKVWNKSISFYQIDFLNSDIDLKTDWRFCEVKDKRTQSVFLGYYNGTFPVELPIESNTFFNSHST